MNFFQRKFVQKQIHILTEIFGAKSSQLFAAESKPGNQQ
jgi:hypothetical protein